MCTLKTISCFFLNLRFSKFVNNKVARPFKFNGMSENHCFAIEYHNVSSSAVSNPTLRERNHAKFFSPLLNRVPNVVAVHTERMRPKMSRLHLSFAI